MKKDSVYFVEARDYLLCMNHPSTTVETQVGFVEYADRGMGPVILSIHGGPGGFDQGLLSAEIFRKNGYRVIAVSRPGYLNTPLLVEKTPEAQAKLLVSLLDTLNFEKAIVLGVSAGGPVAYAMAQNYPERVSALVAIDSVASYYSKLQQISRFERWLYMSYAGSLLLNFTMNTFPNLLIKTFLTTESSLDSDQIGKQLQIIRNDQTQIRFMRLLMKTMTQNYAQRSAGLETDRKILSEIRQLNLDKITCPSLIIHGSHDADVEPLQAEYAASAISNSALQWIKNGSHIGFWVGENALDAQRKALLWLNQSKKD